MQDAGLSSAQHYDVCRFPHKLYFSVGRVGEERKSAFISVCNKRKVKAMLLLLPWLHFYQQRY